MNGTIAEIQPLFDAVSAAGGLPAFAFDADGICRIETETGLSVHFQIREDAEDLVMLSPLGTVPEEVQGEVFRALLSANFYWDDTFGATLCWNDRVAEAVLEYAVPTAALTAETLATVLAHFVELARAWKDRLEQLVGIARTEAADDGEAPEAAAAAADGVGLRV